MAYGRKTGGRDFVKGDPNNPCGKRKQSRDILDLKQQMGDKFIVYVHRWFMYRDFQKLKDFVEKHQGNVMELAVAAMIARMITKGDMYSLQELLTRCLGKPEEKPLSATNVQVPILQYFPAQPTPALEALKAELRASGDLPEEHTMPDIALIMAQAAPKPVVPPATTPDAVGTVPAAMAAIFPSPAAMPGGSDNISITGAAPAATGQAPASSGGVPAAPAAPAPQPPQTGDPAISGKDNDNMNSPAKSPGNSEQTPPSVK